MKTFVMGDIHGAYKALKQCLERASFNYEEDELIQLGDVADGQDEVYQCVEELLKVKKLIAIKGNHDEWLNEFIQTAYHPDRWIQGGVATAISYLRPMGKEHLVLQSAQGYKTALNPGDIPETHQLFFRQQHLYYIDDLNNCFVHAGFDMSRPFKGQRPQEYYWNRNLWTSAVSFEADKSGQKTKPVFQMATEFKEIFLGHTTTAFWKTNHPMHAANLWNLDTGGGSEGRLTIMNLHTKQYWQSDLLRELYPDGKVMNWRKTQPSVNPELDKSIESGDIDAVRNVYKKIRISSKP